MTQHNTKPELGIRDSVVVVMGSQFVGVFALIGVPMVLVRTLSDSDFGLYYQFQLLLQTILIFAIAGFPEALVYFVARKRTAAADFLLGALIQLGVTLLLITAIVTLVGTRVVGWIVDPILIEYLAPILLAVAFSAIGDTLFTAQTAQKKFRTFSVVFIGFALLQSAVVVTAAFMTRRLDAVIWANVATAGAKALGALIYIGIEVLRTGGTARPRMLREQWVYALPYAGTQALKKIHGLIHKFFVSSSYTAGDYGLYEIATKKVPALGIVRGSFVQVMTPHFAEMEERKRHDAILALWHASVSRLSLVYYPVTAILIAFAPEAITVFFTDKNIAATPIFRIFALIMIGDALGGIEALLKAFAQNRFILWTTAIQLGIALIGSWVGLNWIGLAGPAVAVVLSSWIGQWIRIARIHGLLGVSVASLLPWGHLVKTAALAATCAWVGWHVGRFIVSPLVTLLVGIPFAAFAYITAALVLGLIPASERARLAGVWKRLGPNRGL